MIRTYRNELIAVLVLLGIICLTLSSKADETSDRKITFGGFVDTYYGFDFNEPKSSDRPYMTQAVRDNEFNVNLAFVEAKLTSPKTRGRIALQTGTSVQANYAAEPSLGTNSGPSLSRNIQEATIGYRPTEKLWIDAGVYSSHIGLESFVSKDNWTYTRSLTADFTPYYESGVKASYRLSDQWSAQLHVMNGWGTISDANKDKSLGAQLSFEMGDWALTYNNYYGNDNGVRFFNQLIAKYAVNTALQGALLLDYGEQKSPQAGGTNNWQGATLLSQYRFSPTLAAAFRLEWMRDKNLSVVSLLSTVTPGGSGFEVWGASIGFDSALDENILWRTEVRGFQARDQIFETRSGTSRTDVFAVTSLALTQ